MKSRTILKFVLLVLVLTMASMPSTILAQTVVTTDSTYCVRFTNLDEFPEFRFLIDSNIETSKRLVTNLDCVPVFPGEQAKLVAVPAAEYIKGNLQANLDNPNRVEIDYTFDNPTLPEDLIQVLNGQSEEEQNTNTENGEETETNTGETEGNNDPEIIPVEKLVEESQASPEVKQQARDLSSQYADVAIEDSVTLNLNSDTGTIEATPIFVTYRSTDATNVESETFEYRGDGARPEPTINKPDYLLYIAVGLTLATVITLGSIYVWKLRKQKATLSADNKSGKKTKSRAKETRQPKRSRRVRSK